MTAMEKKIYVKPNVSVIEMASDCLMQAGSLGTSEKPADGTSPLSCDGFEYEEVTKPSDTGYFTDDGWR